MWDIWVNAFKSDSPFAGWQDLRRPGRAAEASRRCAVGGTSTSPLTHSCLYPSVPRRIGRKWCWPTSRSGPSEPARWPLPSRPHQRGPAPAPEGRDGRDLQTGRSVRFCLGRPRRRMPTSENGLLRTSPTRHVESAHLQLSSGLALASERIMLLKSGQRVGPHPVWRLGERQERRGSW